MKAILIGGPCDHQVMELSDNWNKMTIAIGNETIVYIKDWAGYLPSGDEVYFFRHETLSHKEALKIVFNYYGEKK